MAYVPQGRGEPIVEDRHLIERTLRRVRGESGLPLLFAGLVSRDEESLCLKSFAGDLVGALRGLTVGFGYGIGGKAAVMRRPLAVENYYTANRISHHYDHVMRAERLQACFAVPVVVGGRVRAVLYGATRESMPIGERVLRMASDATRDLEQQLAVSNALSMQVESARSMLLQTEPSDRASQDWEAVREAFAELRVLATRVGDESVRAELSGLADRLAGVGHRHEQEQPRAPKPRLTARETDVLACISQGMSNSDAATLLGLSTETVKSYLRSAMRRLGASSRWEAVVTARRLGLLP